MNKYTKAIFSVLVISMLFVSALPLMVKGYQAPVGADPESWYMTVEGVAHTDDYTLYPYFWDFTKDPIDRVYNPHSLKIGFSQFGEMINTFEGIPGTSNVGLQYGEDDTGRDPFAPPWQSDVDSAMPKEVWQEGWLINITYYSVRVGHMRNVWAMAQHSDLLAYGNGWIRVDDDYPGSAPTESDETPYYPGLYIGTVDQYGWGGRKTNGTAITDPLEVLYDGPRRFVARCVTHIKDWIQYDTTSVVEVSLLDVIITIDFNKDKREVNLLKDVKITATKATYGKIPWELFWGLEEGSAHPPNYPMSPGPNGVWETSTPNAYMIDRPTLAYGPGDGTDYGPEGDDSYYNPYFWMYPEDVNEFGCKRTEIEQIYTPTDNPEDYPDGLWIQRWCPCWLDEDVRALFVQFSNRGEWDLGEPPVYASYVHFFTQGDQSWPFDDVLFPPTGTDPAYPGWIDWAVIDGIYEPVFDDGIREGLWTKYGWEYTLTTTVPPNYYSRHGPEPWPPVAYYGSTIDLAQIISAEDDYIGWAGFWPSLSDWSVDGHGLDEWWRSINAYDWHGTDTDEPFASPYIIGEWDFLLSVLAPDIAKDLEFPPGQYPALCNKNEVRNPVKIGPQFRGVTMYGVTETSDAEPEIDYFWSMFGSGEFPMRGIGIIDEGTPVPAELPAELPEELQRLFSDGETMWFLLQWIKRTGEWWPEQLYFEDYLFPRGAWEFPNSGPTQLNPFKMGFLYRYGIPFYFNPIIPVGQADDVQLGATHFVSLAKEAIDCIIDGSEEEVDWIFDRLWSGNVVYREVAYYLYEKFRPWDIKNSVEKDTKRMVEFGLGLDTDHEITGEDLQEWYDVDDEIIPEETETTYDYIYLEGTDIDGPNWIYTPGVWDQSLYTQAGWIEPTFDTGWEPGDKWILGWFDIYCRYCETFDHDDDENDLLFNPEVGEWFAYSTFPERVLVEMDPEDHPGELTLLQRGRDYIILCDYEFKDATIVFIDDYDSTEPLDIEEGALIKVLYSVEWDYLIPIEEPEDPRFFFDWKWIDQEGSYEWITAGRDAASVDALGASMVTQAFDSIKEITVEKPGLDMKEPVYCPTVPNLLRKFGTGDTRADYYYDYPNDMRLALKDDWSSSEPIASSNIITVGGPLANAVTEYFNEFTMAIYRGALGAATPANDFLLVSDWGATFLREQRKYVLDTTIPGALTQEIGGVETRTGIGIISTYKDINGTVGFVVYGYSGEDTVWTSAILYTQQIPLFLDDGNGKLDWDDVNDNGLLDPGDAEFRDDTTDPPNGVWIPKLGAYVTGWFFGDDLMLGWIWADDDPGAPSQTLDPFEDQGYPKWTFWPKITLMQVENPGVTDLVFTIYYDLPVTQNPGGHDTLFSTDSHPVMLVVEELGTISEKPQHPDP